LGGFVGWLQGLVCETEDGGNFEDVEDVEDVEGVEYFVPNFENAHENCH
jgi:hypothetical protein